MDTVLVVGGAGAVGSQLCEALHESGYDVVCMDIADPSNAHGVRHLIEEPNFQYVRHSATHPFKVNCKYIYHFASLTDSLYSNLERPVEVLKTELLGVMNSLGAAMQNGATVIYGSSSSVYAYRNGEFGTAFPSAHVKSAAESLCYSYFKEYGVDVKVARMFETYGRGMGPDDQRIIPRMVVAALQNSDIVIRDARGQLRTFCWVGDVVRGLMALAEKTRDHDFEVMNFGGNESITLEELAHKIVNMTHSHSRIINEPRPSRYSSSKIADTTLTERLLGWQPQVSLDQGLGYIIEHLDKRLKVESSIYKCESWIEFY
ncbi:MAG: NAD-dependent epimerase/dehydratase family protein [Rikenellaceae bacterium]|nr:NAD-dependent epimerase/dehydratase family protein [Rikenellaceae bacterium]